MSYDRIKKEWDKIEDTVLSWDQEELTDELKDEIEQTINTFIEKAEISDEIDKIEKDEINPGFVWDGCIENIFSLFIQIFDDDIIMIDTDMDD